MKLNRNWIYLILILCIGIYFIAKDRQDILVSDKVWDCEDFECRVKFTIKNKTSNQFLCSISLRAHRQHIDRNSDAILNKVVGEKIIEQELYPNEEKDIIETLKIKSKKAHIINVKVWKKQDKS